MIPGLDHSQVDGQWVRTPRLPQPPQSLPLGLAPEPTPKYTHWIENYWVKHNDFWYFRYCWMEGRKIRRLHIPGGNVSSGAAKRRATLVDSLLTANWTPSSIEYLIKRWRNDKASVPRNAHFLKVK